MALYSDFTRDFTVHPIKGDLAVIEDAQAIASSIRNLIFTDRYERPFAPKRGAGIPQTLFDNIGADTEFLLENRILETIAADEPRARNVSVNIVVRAEYNGYAATIFFTPINSHNQVQIDAIFKRVR